MNKEIEYLDIYDENKNHIGKEDRKIVHEKGLWHKTIHCWLFDNEGNIFFQIRANNEGFYTTASGHIQAGETINEAFDREVKEEIGYDVDESKLIFVQEVEWKMDKLKKDGTMFIDRAWANVCICPYEGIYNDFNFQPGEVDGIVKVNAKNTLELFNDNLNEIDATIITSNGIEERKVKKEEFLINEGETYLGKYGFVLESVIENTRS